MSLFRFFIFFVLLVIGNASTIPSYNGLALTPPMGWNSWNRFHCGINENIVESIIDAMASNGMAEAGYNTVIVDDCWPHYYRNPNGTLLSNQYHFPRGMKRLADIAHSKKLKFGLYQSPTQGTCQMRPGSYGYERRDAQTFASWGIDYLKYDWCETSEAASPEMFYDLPNMTDVQRAAFLFARMSTELQATGRDIVYSLSDGYLGVDITDWAPYVSNLWRISVDIRNNWHSVVNNYHMALRSIDKSGPGHWNDPDMLEVGNTQPGHKGQLNVTEQKTHFALWAVLPAPLIAGNDIRSMSKDTLEILTNEYLIRINQDPLGLPAKQIPAAGDFLIMNKQLQKNAYGVVIVNLDSKSKLVSLSAQEIGLDFKRMNLTNAWTGKNEIADTIQGELLPHDNFAYIIEKA